LDQLPDASGGSFDLLEGVRVLDLTTSIAGPFATMLLGDMGAEIIKLERLGGDDSRSWGPPFLDGESLWFLSVNRNKRSVELDITTSAGQAVLAELAKLADVVIVNCPAATAIKLGIDPASIHAIRADSIYVSITGFGMDGARADWTGYDLIAEGYSGIMDLTGEPDSPPQKVGAPAADMLAGQDAAFAIAAALASRGVTGRGRVIDISLVDSMTRFLTCRIVPYLGSDQPVRRSGGRDSVIAIYQTFQTADEPLTLALGNDAIWRRFWKAVGHPDMLERAEFSSNSGRRAGRDVIVERIQALLLARPRAEWLALFVEARIPAGPINRIEDVVRDEAMLERGMFYRMREGGRVIPQVGTGIRIDGATNAPRSAPPRLGDSTEHVLQNLLGYSKDRISALRTSGTISK
jgi:crotonobetainyl-CoA:carnitine CoA-transferase CaiB-like acyl-CoA transferase